jgi:hypothetical protein
MHWKQDVACSYRVLVGKPEGKRHVEDRGLDERIILS